MQTTTCVDFSYSTSASKIFLSHQYMKTTRDASTSREAVAPSANYSTFAWQNLTSTTVPSLIRHFLSNTSARATMSPTSSPRHAIPTHSTLFVLISWEILRIASHIIHSTLPALTRGSVGFQAPPQRSNSHEAGINLRTPTPRLAQRGIFYHHTITQSLYNKIKHAL